MSRSILMFASVILLTKLAYSQSPELKFPDPAQLPENFQKVIAHQIVEFKRLFHDDSTDKSYSTTFMLGKIDYDSNYSYLFLAEYWIAFHYKEIIPELIKRVTVKKEIGLINSADLIIWERIENNQMEFYGHGLNCADDLFTIAGRANRLLTVITGENFGHVSMYSTKEQLIEIQNRWIKWIKPLSKVSDKLLR